MNRHSKWMTRALWSAGKRFYQVYRLIDTKYGFCERNLETIGGYYERHFDAEMLAARLNEEERQKHEHSGDH